MTLYIASVVEGHTEQLCIERLLQRIWNELLGGAERLQVLEPFCRPRGSLVHADVRVLEETVLKASLALNRRTV